MIVRLEESRDRAATLEVERAAFRQGPGGDSGDHIAAAIEAIRADDPASFALVADDDGEVVGHVQFSRAWIGETPVVLLGPVGVLPDRQRGGVGSELVARGLDEARARGEAAVILLGDPRFYSRFGFRPAAELGLKNPATGVQPDGFVVEEEDFQIAVLEGGDARFRGPVRWHPSL